MTDIKAAAIITAGGLGKRFDAQGGDNLPKQFISLSGKPVIAHSVLTFENLDFVKNIVVVVPENWVEYTRREVVEKFNLKKVCSVVSGGSERQESVLRGFKAIPDKPDIVVVHDGVRPFVTLELIDETIIKAYESGGAIAAIPATDTIKISTPEHNIERTVPRENIWLAQTPQAFKYDIIREALEEASREKYLGTDEAELVERLGKEVVIVLGSRENLKITTPEDIKHAELILSSEDRNRN
jgi:2-C-methyl-D-erythritol 4-phosphate cytidylyltransferase